MEVTARINRKKRTLVIEMPLQKPAPSRSSGKTLVVATTHGCKTTEARHSRRPIVVTANAFVYLGPQQKAATRKTRQRSRSGRLKVDVQPLPDGGQPSYANRPGKDVFAD
jgi:hypothetical protein